MTNKGITMEKQPKFNSLLDLRNRFPDEKACRFHLEKIRWNTKQFTYPVLFIAEENVGEAVFVGKPPVTFHVIRTDTDDFSVDVLEYFILIAEVTGLFGAARTVVFGIKINNQIIFADHRGNIDHSTVLIGESECRNAAAYFYFVHTSA